MSQSTVSRALRGDPNVSEDTRRRIASIAEQLNYKVDKNASNLRCQHSSTLALLFFEDPTTDPSLINPFFLSMLGSITRACAHHGYDLLTSFQQFSHNWHVDYEDSGKADGLILLGYGDYLTYRQRLEQLVQQGTHFVCWGAVQKDQPGLSVGCDNYQGGFDAVTHLVKLGRRRIAFLGGASGRAPEFSERYRGYAAALAAAGLPIPTDLQVDAISTEVSGYEAAQQLVAQNQSFDAVMGASDLIAIGAIRALQECGFNVPEDVSVVGFDDIPAASLVNPPLTTVTQDTWHAGEILVKTLLQLIQGEPAQSTVLPAPLVVRRSCGTGRVSTPALVQLGQPQRQKSGKEEARTAQRERIDCGVAEQDS